ncbi:MAG: hypothetical protein Q8L00_10905, partial [Deltaproteobacteria bacterium]|nr:hypothetical protein [Deltaproteobacteria bacterium]
SRLRALPIMASGIGFRFFLDCTVKSEKMATGRRVGAPGVETRRRRAATPNPLAGKKFLDSWPVLFYYLRRNSLRGGDPGASVALFYTFEILKQRRPGSLGKALDSEAGQGCG